MNKISPISSFSVFNPLLLQLSARQKKVLVIVSIALAAIALLVMLFRNNNWNPFRGPPPPPGPGFVSIPIPVSLPSPMARQDLEFFQAPQAKERDLSEVSGVIIDSRIGSALISSASCEPPTLLQGGILSAEKIEWIIAQNKSLRGIVSSVSCQPIKHQFAGKPQPLRTYKIDIEIFPISSLWPVKKRKQPLAIDFPEKLAKVFLGEPVDDLQVILKTAFDNLDKFTMYISEEKPHLYVFKWS